MKGSDKRTYFLLGWLAFAHALCVSLLAVFCLQAARNRLDFTLSWIGLTTLWFLWPVVLVLHRGRSWRRCLLFVLLSGLFFLPSLSQYLWRAAPAFGLPVFVRMEPVSIWKYYRAWWAGRADAQRDIAAGILAREVYGFGAAGGGPLVDVLRERYHIETRPVAGCVVNENILGHAAGYNRTSQREVDRRFGRGSIAKTEAESLLGMLYQRRDDSAHSRELARRFSIFPPESKITLQSVEVVLIKEDGALTEVAEDQLGRLVREIEQSLRNEIVETPSSFGLHVTANFAPNQLVDYEVGGSNTSLAYDSIRQKLPRFRWLRLDGDALSVRLNFVVRPHSNRRNRSN